MDAPATIHNLLGRADDHANMCYDPECVSAVVEINLKDGPDGHVVGSTHIPGERFAKMLGQADPDTVRLKTVSLVGATTAFGGPMGAHVHYGDPAAGANDPIQTLDRVMHVVPDADNHGDIITTHFTVPMASSDGAATSHFPPGGLGTIKLQNTGGTSEEHQATTTRAFQRSMRWSHAKGKTPEELAATCTKVGTDATARFLVPIDPGSAPCPMSTLIRSNVERNGADFCGGHYSPAKRTVVPNAKAEPCTVMTGAHFNQVFSQLHKNLTPQASVEQGITTQIKSLHPGTVGTSNAKVQLHMNFGRMTTAEVMGTEHAPVIHKEAAMRMLGEDVPAGTTFGSSAPNSEGELVRRVFEMQLPGEDEDVVATLSRSKGAVAGGSTAAVGALEILPDAN